ncbi:MAG: exo-alpha-sialidase [Bacteroidales bacterium]|nr:exo-alpha-sialidase [Bacteroidales bacterium]
MKKTNHLILLLLLAGIISACRGQNEDILPNIVDHNLSIKKSPLFTGRKNKGLVNINISVPDTGESVSLHGVKIYLLENSDTDFLESMDIQYFKKGKGNLSQSHFGTTSNFATEQIKLNGSAEFEPGSHVLSFDFRLKENVILEQSFRLDKVELIFGRGQKLVMEAETGFAYRPAHILREAGQDNCHTYRIPGLVSTNEGTLIAVYDKRYKRSKDLQEDIDIGMSRSTDGGRTWEPVKIIMDMGEWGGRPENLNGIGDPCVLYDHTAGTLWVAALWMSGLTPDDMLWWSSQPGMSPKETGQFMLTKSTDDGLTWSEPINITEQIKDPAWQLMLQGPGKGITMDDGTLVFPAQFKADIGKKAIDGGQYTCHSTIIYSRDGGETWHTAEGAKPNTTEAQVVQLANGDLMLNMRDDRNRQVKDETNGRAVATTADMGRTWTIHPSSNSALPEPNCMASLIAADLQFGGEEKQGLFFSNPDNRLTRTNMTIKASLDGGLTWPEEYQVELNEEQGFGYSCMTMIDSARIGILYEGIGELYFQVIPVEDVVHTIEGGTLKYFLLP